MKKLIKKVKGKAKRLLALSALLFVPFLAIQATNASAHFVAYYPTATCHTSAINAPLPNYTCCELLNKKGHHIWRNTWVPYSCANASPYARGDMGCDVNSPEFGTGSPIMGNCTFSYSTGRYE